MPGIELATRYLPGTGGRDVGGDFYIAHPLEDGRVLLVIGDVMGHGAQAAARMGQLRAVLAAYAYDGDPPDRVLAHLSVRAPTLLDLPMATVLAALYDPVTRQLTFSLAGHLPPLIVPRDGEPYFADARPGPPLGAGAREYTRHVATIPPHATLVFYTDGLIEERTLAIDVGMERCATPSAASTSRRTRWPTTCCARWTASRAARTTSPCSSCGRSAVLQRGDRWTRRGTTPGGRAGRPRGPPEQVMPGAHFESPLARDRHGQEQRVASPRPRARRASASSTPAPPTRRRRRGSRCARTAVPA